MKSIKTRLTVNFMIVIIISVLVLEMMLIYIVKQNYYSSLKGNLANQIKISADMYSRYYSDTSLEENILHNVDAFWNRSNARVEVINIQGDIIMDSLGKFPDELEVKEDVYSALKGDLGEWTGSFDGQKVMAISYPLLSGEEVVGALRFIASTKEIDAEIKSTITIFMIIGLLVVIAMGILSMFLANSIVIPLQEVTRTAGQMAEGDYTVKSKKKRDDEIGKLSDTLNYMVDEIVRKEKLKNEFISSVSHELRTPLTSIIGWTITLKNKDFQKGKILDDGLETIEKESKRLTAMVEELLDFSKFVSEKIKLELKPVDLKVLLEDIHKQLMPRAMRKNIEFTLEHLEDMPMVLLDGNRLKQVFINILDNAFNFTDIGGRIRLIARINEEEMLFIIEDNGCGISEEELPMVMEKFYKGKTSASQNGIGLSICKEIMEMMNGEVTIISKLHEGTQVVLSLPFEEIKHVQN